jgi:hypothetical protein
MSATLAEENVFGEPISVYTQEQGIRDGVLIPVAKEESIAAGFPYPVLVTGNLFHSYIEPANLGDMPGQSAKGRMWDILFVLYQRALSNKSKSLVEFEVLFLMKKWRVPRHENVRLWAVCGPGDQGEITITIMLPEDY